MNKMQEDNITANLLANLSLQPDDASLRQGGRRNEKDQPLTIENSGGDEVSLDANPLNYMAFDTSISN